MNDINEMIKIIRKMYIKHIDNRENIIRKRKW